MMHKLMIVEDERHVKEGIINSFRWKDFGYRIISSAENGIEALSLIHNDPPQVIITDIRMPQMNGLELAKIVSENYPDIKIVMLSAFSDFSYAQDAIKYGAKGYLLKPLKESDLEEVMQRISELIHEEKRLEEQSGSYFSQDELMLRKILSEDIFFNESDDAKMIEYGSKIKEFIRTAVCSFSSNTEKNKTNLLECILSKSFEYWNKLCAKTVYFNQYFTIILHSEAYISSQDICNIIQSYRLFIENEINKADRSVALTFGVSNCYRKISNVKKSYHEALCAYESKYFNGKGTTILYQDVKRKDSWPANSNSVNNSIVNLVNSVLMYDKIQIVYYVHEIFNYIWQDQNLSEYDIGLVCTEVVFAISVKAKEIGFCIEILDRKYITEKISQIDTFEHLKDWFGDFMISVSDEIRQANRKKLILSVKRRNTLIGIIQVE